MIILKSKNDTMSKAILFILLSYIVFASQSCSNKSESEEEEISKETEEIDFTPSFENLNIFTDLDEGLAYARKVNKPVLLNFTGYTCINSRKLEDFILLGEPRVYRMCRDEFVNIWLYVDDKSIEQNWFEYEQELLQKSTQPELAVLDTSGALISPSWGYQDALDNFADKLEDYTLKGY